MRQTSRAVALLLALEGANAAALSVFTNVANSYNQSSYQTLLLPLGGAYNNLAGAQASRSAPYNSCPTFNQNSASGTNPCPTTNYNPTSGVWGALTPQKSNTADLGSGAWTGKGSAGSLCVPCIQAIGVWCSRTYAYALVASATTYQTNSASDTAIPMTVAWSAVDSISDNGSCCGNRNTLQDAIFKIDGTIKTAAITASKADAQLMSFNGYACVLWKNIQTSPAAATIATQAVNSAVSAAKSTWWCSNGLFHLTTAANSGTAMY